MTDHTFASAIIGATQKHPRKPADWYPTPPEATIALLDHLQLPVGTSVWEPACGDGAMSRVMEVYRLDVTSTDLRPDCGYGRGGIDFLDTDLECDWIITNPPFSIAAEFIEHALSITPNVAMLLKSTYWHAKGRYDLFMSSAPTQILPLTWRPSFLEKERGNSPLMDVIWVVWEGENKGGTSYCPLRRPSAKVALLTDDSLDDLLA